MPARIDPYLPMPIALAQYHAPSAANRICMPIFIHGDIDSGKIASIGRLRLTIAPLLLPLPNTHICDQRGVNGLLAASVKER